VCPANGFLMGKKKTRNQELENESEAALLRVFSNWVMNRLDRDYGLDYVIRLAHPHKDGGREITPLSCFVQLKAAEKFNGSECVSRDISTDFFESYWQSTEPILLVFYESSSQSLYWTCIQEYLYGRLNEENPSWWSQDTVRIKIDRDSKLGDVDELGEELDQIAGRIRRRYTRKALQARIESIRSEVNPTHNLVMYQVGLMDRVMNADQDEDEYSSYNVERNLTKLKQSIEYKQIPDDYFVDMPFVSSSAYLFKLYEICDRAASFSDEYGLELTEAFEKTRNTAYHEIVTHEVGNVYLDCKRDEGFTIVQISQLGPEGTGGMWMAEMQYEDGCFWDENAVAIAQRMDYHLLEYNRYENCVSVHNSCGEGGHNFETIIQTDRWDTPNAICSKCGLSLQTVMELTSEPLDSLPAFCERCGSLSEDYVFRNETHMCPSCDGEV